MSIAQIVLGLVAELAALAGDILQAEKEGKAARVEEILPELQTSIRKQIANTRAKLKYGE